jgi:micrococcal nuclease
MARAERMRYKRIQILLLCLFITLLFTSLYAQNAVRVKRVIDGDTLKINYKGKEESVRLIGIDAPESRPNKKAKNDAQRSGEDLKTITAMGKEATNYVKTLVKPGDMVKIELDVQKRDKYRRLLGYVYLSNGKMLNEEIVKAGYANLMTIPPNVKYQERFLKAYKEAREHGRGLWK